MNGTPAAVEYLRDRLRNLEAAVVQVGVAAAALECSDAQRERLHLCLRESRADALTPNLAELKRDTAAITRETAKMAGAAVMKAVASPDAPVA